MQYQYSYEEQWQPKDFLVTFRMYQLNFDEKNSGVFKKYWNNSGVKFFRAFSERGMKTIYDSVVEQDQKKTEAVLHLNIEALTILS